MARKLYKQFISDLDEPSDALLAPLADAFRKANYHIQVPLQMILGSQHFYDAATLRKRVKSPVEFMVGMIRSLEVLRPTVSLDQVAQSCSGMGQSLYAPPSVAGWDGGPAWINTTAMLGRTNASLSLIADTGRFDPLALATRNAAKDPKDQAKFYLDLLVQDSFATKLVERVEAASLRTKDPKDVVTLILTAPEYQLG